MNGWIKLHRKLLAWEWIDDPSVLALFIHLLLRASHKTTKWHGTPILPGQVIVGRRKLAKATGLSEKQVRRSLNCLKTTHEVAIKTNNKFSLVTLNNWALYQGVGPQEGQQRANKGPHREKEKNIKKIRTNTEEEIKIFRGAETMKEILKRKYPQFPIKD